MSTPTTNFPTLDDILAEIEREENWAENSDDTADSGGDGDNFVYDSAHQQQLDDARTRMAQTTAELMGENQLENRGADRVSSSLDMNDNLNTLTSGSAAADPATTGIPQLQRADSGAAGATPGGGIWSDQLSSLSPRQRALPRLDYRMLGGLVAIMLLVVGVGSATMLVSKPQDLRQQAYESTLPTVSGDPATLTQEQLEQRAQQNQLDQQRPGGEAVPGDSQTEPAGESMVRTPVIWWAGALLAVALIGLVLFLGWLFLA